MTKPDNMKSWDDQRLSTRFAAAASFTAWLGLISLMQIRATIGSWHGEEEKYIDWTWLALNIIQHASMCYASYNACITHFLALCAEVVALHRIVFRRTPGDVQLQSHLSSRSFFFLLRQGRKAGREVQRCQICIDLQFFDDLSAVSSCVLLWKVVSTHVNTMYNIIC